MELIEQADVPTLGVYGCEGIDSRVYSKGKVKSNPAPALLFVISHGHCIVSLQLKTILSTEKYKAMVYRFIKFDDEMTLLTFKWREIWSLANAYHMEGHDIERRRRMCSVHSILQSIKNTKFKIDFKIFEDPKQTANTVKWLTMDDRDTVWNYTVHFLRNRWVECDEHRLFAEITKVQCLKCDFALATHYV